jgi:cation:H+ antiporter
MPPVIEPYLYVLTGFVLLYLGGEVLVRGSSRLARRAGVSALVAGLTVMAFATSAPELAVTVDAALKGRNDIALGNVVGSNIANLGLILGVAALIQGLTVHAQLVRIDVRVLIGISILLPLLLLDGKIGRIEGALLFLGLLGYLVYTVVLARRARATVKAEFQDAIPLPIHGAWLEIGMILAGIALLVAGAEAMVYGAMKVAARYQVSTAIVGLTVVALGTSLPELATSIVAALKKEGDLVVGNVIGSNIFNLLGILGISSMVAPIQPVGIQRLDLAAMVLVAVILLLLMRRGMRLTRLEGIFLLVCYFTYIGYLVSRSAG